MLELFAKTAVMRDKYCIQRIHFVHGEEGVVSLFDERASNNIPFP